MCDLDNVCICKHICMDVCECIRVQASVHADENSILQTAYGVATTRWHSVTNKDKRRECFVRECYRGTLMVVFGTSDISLKVNHK